MNGGFLIFYDYLPQLLSSLIVIKVCDLITKERMITLFLSLNTKREEFRFFI